VARLVFGRERINRERRAPIGSRRCSLMWLNRDADRARVNFFWAVAAVIRSKDYAEALATRQLTPILACRRGICQPPALK